MSDLVIINRANKEMTHNDNDIMIAHQRILERISFYFHKPVYINYQDGDYNSENGTDIVTVNMWSAKAPSEMDLPDVDEAFGLKYCADGVFVPNDGYISFGDTVPLIQYKDNNFYFLYDVCEFNTPEELTLMSKLLDGILIQLSGSAEAVELEIAKNAKIENDKRVKALMNRVLANERHNRDNRKNNLKNNKAELENNRRRVRELNLSIITDERILNRNNDSISEIEDTLNKELALIISNKKVADVNINSDGYIVVQTKEIFANVLAKDNITRRYRFGEFDISIDVSNGSIRFINRNNVDKRHSVWGDKCNHPHVNEGGEGCLGNASTLIMDCVDRYQWGVLADILINYLESVNVDDSAGKCYYNWDNVDVDGNKLAEQFKPDYAGRDR